MVAVIGNIFVTTAFREAIFSKTLSIGNFNASNKERTINGHSQRSKDHLRGACSIVVEEVGVA